MLSNKFKINGDRNLTAGRDLNIHFHEVGSPLRFFDQDIKEVILSFSQVVRHEIEVTDEVNRINAERKNQINNLSVRYFNIILDESMSYFQQIEDFLKSPINLSELKMYENTVYELNQKINIHRDEFEKFDLIFECLYNFILENNTIELRADRRLIWIMLHYMYWKCDLGEGGEC
ncbi:hypothetical protein A3844_22600 [Paenibacillus helianthi]|uniref:ABC-three component systems C-terminal domain-containing protein n=1 Tax=Paenibacillus helianthi TaxID=1349432 RepID=A0ABX3EHZ2_9BACL|nr:ABC-three component system protein [Paenibacillus helianthi]OKP83249.1 hypothetical protein A3844_22600 [Paenibacillus helianthi]